MARVKMLSRLSGTRNGEPWPDVGDELDVPDDEADTLVALGHAERTAAGATPAKRARKAVVEAPEER